MNVINVDNIVTLELPLDMLIQYYDKFTALMKKCVGKKTEGEVRLSYELGTAFESVFAKAFSRPVDACSKIDERGFDVKYFMKESEKIHEELKDGIKFNSTSTNRLCRNHPF